MVLCARCPFGRLGRPGWLLACKPARASGRSAQFKWLNRGGDFSRLAVARNKLSAPLCWLDQAAPIGAALKSLSTFHRPIKTSRKHNDKHSSEPLRKQFLARPPKLATRYGATLKAALIMMQGRLDGADHETRDEGRTLVRLIPAASLAASRSLDKLARPGRVRPTRFARTARYELIIHVSRSASLVLARQGSGQWMLSPQSRGVPPVGVVSKVCKKRSAKLGERRFFERARG